MCSETVLSGIAPGRNFWRAEAAADRVPALLTGAGQGMQCLGCGSAAVTERPEHTAQGYRRFRCRECGRQFNERSAGVLNRTHTRATSSLSWCSGVCATD